MKKKIITSVMVVSYVGVGMAVAGGFLSEPEIEIIPDGDTKPDSGLGYKIPGDDGFPHTGGLGFSLKVRRAPVLAKEWKMKPGYPECHWSLNGENPDSFNHDGGGLIKFPRVEITQVLSSSKGLHKATLSLRVIYKAQEIGTDHEDKCRKDSSVSIYYHK